VVYRFRYVDDADLARWPDWYEVDMGAYHHMDSGVVMEWEEATGYRIMDTDKDSPANVGEAAKRREMKALVATQWLAVRLSGNTTPWAQFRPKALQIEYPPETVAAAAEAEAGGSGNRPGPANRASRRAKSASAAATSKPRARKAAVPRRSAS
jgi:hypothetical protein